jgi:hypothetical protein
LFHKTFYTQTKIKNSKGFESWDKKCTRSKGDHPSFFCTIAYAIHFLHFLSEGAGGKRNTLGFMKSNGRCEIHRCANNLNCSWLFFIFIYCLPSRFLFMSLSQKTNPFVALPSQCEEHVVANQFLFPKIFYLCVFMCQ